MRLPAGPRENGVARLVVGIAGDNDLGDALAFHDAADWSRRGVGFSSVHASAHVGIKREEKRPEQDLPVARLWYRQRL